MWGPQYECVGMDPRKGADARIIVASASGKKVARTYLGRQIRSEEAQRPSMALGCFRHYKSGGIPRAFSSTTIAKSSTTIPAR